MADLSYNQVGQALKRFGHYRTTRTQRVAAQGEPDGISGATVIALGLRETHLQNINGGAVWSNEENRWVEAPPEHQDAGVFQISRDWQAYDLKRMPGVEENTWSPVIDGITAFTPGFVPRFEEALQFTMQGISEALAYAEDHAVQAIHRPRFAVAAHNAGKGGALRGYREGDVDRYTALGNYSAWVFRHRTLINRWLNDHPNWKV